MRQKVERVGEVTQVAFSTRRSRFVGYGVHVFLHRGLMVNAAFPAVAKRLVALLDEVRPAGVVITHHHEDHAGNIELVASRGLPIAAAASTLECCREGIAPAFYRRFTWGAPARLVSDVEPLDIGPLSFIPAPGHSPDHHVLWDADRRLLFGGDLYLGPHVRVARPGEDPRALLRSLQAAIGLQPRSLFDAHRGWVRDPVIALQEKANWLSDTLASIDRRIDEGWDDTAITREVFGAEDLTAFISRGDLSRGNFVRAARAGRVECGG